MDKSTPRPWHTEGSVVADYGYNPIAQMRQPAGQTEIDNAALIVRAVNSHDALLDCTKLLEKTILYEMKRRKHEGDDEGVNLLKMSLHQARAALALATK